MHCGKAALAEPPESDTALVRDDSHRNAGLVQPADGRAGTRQQLEVIGRDHVLTLRRLPIQHAITVQENERWQSHASNNARSTISQTV